MAGHTRGLACVRACSRDVTL